MQRCAWVTSDPAYRAYHDLEWGVPLRNERALFELLTLETFQAGLSWLTVLRKREAFRAAFAGFDPDRVATFGEAQVAALSADPGIIRNRAKIAAATRNARAFLRVQDAFGSFDAYSWGFVGGAPIVNGWRDASQVPATTPEAHAMSRDLRARGFTFVGPTVVYAFMQASGRVMDHTTDCFRHAQLI